MHALDPAHPAIAHFTGIHATLRRQYPDRAAGRTGGWQAGGPAAQEGAGGDDPARPPQQFAESSMLLDERVRIDRAHGRADDVLEQARTARAELQAQKAMLGGPGLGNALARFPAIHNLMIRINQRKNRNTLILGSVIAVLTLLLLAYIFG
jgi:hypothetical protein